VERTEMIAQAAIIASAAVQSRKCPPEQELQASPQLSEGLCFLPERETIPSVPPLNLPELQSLMWDKVGIIRSGESLSEAANILGSWQRFLPQPIDRPSSELNDLVLCGRIMTEAALLRQESRGAHFRTDFPHSLPEWQRRIVFRKDHGAE
jgi:L-aspartate oxidase